MSRPGSADAAGALPADVAELRAELIAIFQARDLTVAADAVFDRLAKRAFAWQFERCAPLRAYWERRGATPATLAHWSEIPAVPAAAFKEVRLLAGPGPEIVFRTSGTTRGRERRGEHHVADLGLYHASLLAGFDTFVRPDGAELALLSIMPPRAALPDSSLAEMISALLERRGTPGNSCFADADGIAHARLFGRLRRAERDGEPVAILGTSLAFVELLDRLEEAGAAVRLPAGSRIVDTGGYKGARRTVAEPALRRAYAERLGVADDHCINEYGMTELLSQCYDTALREHVRALAPTPANGRRKAGPPWLRSRVVDPETLRPLPRGSTGILQHVDLANLFSVLAVQTEDLAVEVEGGFVLHGRGPAATPRGCSIAMDLLLEATRGRP
ncbi:MAG: long-chain fatty acid--CoA ligase [Longimicrobiales bacterium]